MVFVVVLRLESLHATSFQGVFCLFVSTILAFLGPIIGWNLYDGSPETDFNDVRWLLSIFSITYDYDGFADSLCFEALALYVLSLVNITLILEGLVFWRAQMTYAKDLVLFPEKQLAFLDFAPVLKIMYGFYFENFDIASGGKYSRLYVVVLESLENVMQVRRAERSSGARS